MKIAKRVLSVILTVVMLACTLAIPVSADSIYNTADDLPSGEAQSFYIESWYSGKDYKVVLSDSCTLSLNINLNIPSVILYLYDEDGNEIGCDDYNFKSGSGRKVNNDNGGLACNYNDTTENTKVTVDYKLNKGTYYIRIYKEWSLAHGGDGKGTITATYTSENASSGKITYLTLEMEVGDTIRLGTVVEPTDAEVKWSSSKSSVATVSASGKVTAKKEGSTIISAKCGKSVKRVKIIVV